MLQWMQDSFNHVIRSLWKLTWMQKSCKNDAICLQTQFLCQTVEYFYSLFTIKKDICNKKVWFSSHMMIFLKVNNEDKKPSNRGEKVQINKWPLLCNNGSLYSRTKGNSQMFSVCVLASQLGGTIEKPTRLLLTLRLNSVHFWLHYPWFFGLSGLCAIDGKWWMVWSLWEAG